MVVLAAWLPALLFGHARLGTARMCEALARPVSQLILAQADEWIVVNKPPGTPVHDGPLSLLALLKGAGIGEECAPVHRLDVETSGVMLVATRPQAVARLQKALAAPTTLKDYRAVLRGRMHAAQGVWKKKISTKSEGRRNPQGSTQDRVNAQTRYELLGGNAHASVAHLTIRTGRTHQIRKHAALAGHPVIGDTRYGDPAHAASVARRFGFTGLALHSSSLTLELDGKMRTFAADLPSSWAPLLEPLGELKQPTMGAELPELEADTADGLPLRSIETGEMGLGTVVSWNPRKGFGFVARDEGTFKSGVDNAEVYVNQRSILRTSRVDGFRSLRIGERVEFALAAMPGNGRLEAVRVSGPGGAPVEGQPPPPRRLP